MILGTDIRLMESAFSPCLSPAQEADKLPAGTPRLHQHHHEGLNGHSVSHFIKTLALSLATQTYLLTACRTS